MTKVMSDLNIVCINQKKQGDFQSDIFHVISKKNPCLFYKEWEFLSQINGFWHQITPYEREYLQNETEFFDLICHKNLCYVSVITDSLCNLENLFNLFNYYLNLSPIKCICILFRLDFQKNRKLKGIIKLNDFMKKLKNNKILFDTVYFIEK